MCMNLASVFLSVCMILISSIKVTPWKTREEGRLVRFQADLFASSVPFDRLWPKYVLTMGAQCGHMRFYLVFKKLPQHFPHLMTTANLMSTREWMMAWSWYWKACTERACVERSGFLCYRDNTYMLQSRGEALSSCWSAKVHGAVACCLLMIALTLFPCRISLWYEREICESSNIYYRRVRKNS